MTTEVQTKYCAWQAHPTEPNFWFCPECDPDGKCLAKTSAKPGKRTCSREAREAALLRKPISKKTQRLASNRQINFGPGTELKKLLAELGVVSANNCACNNNAAQMNVWGIDGCEEPENFATIVSWLKNGVWSSLDLFGAASRAFFKGIAWRINPLSPFGSLVKLAIQKAKETAGLPVTKCDESDDTRLKVVLLSPSLYPGGAERWMVSLARWLPQHVTACVITAPTMIEKTMRQEMERYCPVLLATDRAAEEFTRQADIILTWAINDLKPYLHDTEAKVVWVAHGACQWTADLIPPVIDVVTHWAGVSEMTRRAFPKDIAPKMTVIYNGVDVERTTPARGRKEIRRAWGIPENKKVVGYIGRLCPNKRPTAIIEAVAKLPADWSAVVVGRGFTEVQEQEVRSLAKQLAPGRVTFTGYQEYVGDAFAACDVWLNASPSEGFSLSLIEAWLASLPCVSTPTGALAELQAVYGSLVQEVPLNADGQTMAKAILAADKNHKQVALARKVAWDNFTSPAMAARWSKYLETIAAE